MEGGKKSLYSSLNSLNGTSSKPSSNNSTPYSSSDRLSQKSQSSSLLRAHSRGSFGRLLFESEKCNFPSISSPHSFLYRFIQFIVFVFRLITPVSYAYIIYHFFYPVNYEAFPGGVYTYSFLTLWMFAEVLFFPYYYYLFYQLNYNLNHELKHFSQDQASRLLLARQCFEAMSISGPSDQAPEVHLRKVIEGWFLDEPIIRVHYGNMASWTSWAFFGKDVKKMTHQEVLDNNEIVNYIEQMCKWKFPPGFNPDLPALRLNLDPMFATQRPFLFYFLIFLTNKFTHFVLRYQYHFLRLKDFSSDSQKIYYRKATVESPPEKKGLPIVFIHGIGTGFFHYLYIIAQLPHDVDIFLIEWPYVAMQMTVSAPSAEETVTSLVSVLNHYRYEKVTIMAHSLGTTLVSWMLHDPIGCNYVASTVLLDPIIFLLCDPTVASVFVYKDPVDSIDLLMHFFLSRELFISNALSRHFAWSYNVSFAEDLLNVRKCCQKHRHLVLPTSCFNTRVKLSQEELVKEDHVLKVVGEEEQKEIWRKHYSSHKEIDHTIILATRDMIVPATAVTRYMNAKRKEGFRNFELIVFEGTHGEVTLLPKLVNLVMRKLFDRSHPVLPSEEKSLYNEEDHTLNVNSSNCN